ncbi:MAG: tetratricopeptide repeat protein [Bacteroidota bacterium]|jgi:tetratricopeptide (TPR) repeat protein
MRYLVFLLPLLLISCRENKPVKKLPKDLDSLIGIFPDSVELLVKRGNMLLEEYKYDKAMADGAKAFRLDSNNVEARLLFAEVLNNRPERIIDDIVSAQRHYDLIIKKDKKNLKALIGLASTYSQLQDYEVSFKYINQALRINPRYRNAYVLKGSNYLKLGKIELAKSSYETAVQQDPDFYEAYIMLGALYQGEKNPICIEYYTTASELRPKDPDVLYSLAYAKQQFGKEEDAVRLYRKMIQIDTTYAEALFQIGYIKQFVIGDLDSAIYYYNSAIVTEPRYVEAWHNMGLCYEDKGDKTRALQSYAKALKYNPEFELSRKQADALR